MADTVTTKVIFSGNKSYVVQLTNRSDGSGETDVLKVDISGLVCANGAAPTRIIVEEVNFNVAGFNYVTLLFDKTVTDEVIGVLKGNGYLSFVDSSGMYPTSAAGTNDILLSTNGGAAGSSYDIVLHLRLKP